MSLGYGESRTCGNCGKTILGPGPWGISPAAVCHCCTHDQRPLAPTQQGCICPPTSEMTCGNLMCPRKSPFKNSGLSLGQLDRDTEQK